MYVSDNKIINSIADQMTFPLKINWNKFQLIVFFCVLFHSISMLRVIQNTTRYNHPRYFVYKILWFSVFFCMCVYRSNWCNENCIAKMSLGPFFLSLFFDCMWNGGLIVHCLSIFGKRTKHPNKKKRIVIFLLVISVLIWLVTKKSTKHTHT